MAIINRKNLILIFLTFFIIVSFFVGYRVGNGENNICAPDDFNFSLFWEAYYKIKEKFVDSEIIDNQKIIYGAISGMAESLGDDYTVFFQPKESKRFLEDVKGSFEGVGMEIGINEGQLQVVSPLEGTPAKKAGLLPGDKILKVGDVLTANVSIDEVVNLIRGPKGTEVALTVYREEWGTSKEVKVVRDKIDIPSLRMDLINSEGEIDINGDISYIKLYQFSEVAAYDFQKTANNILNNSSKKIILDLRNNPGGYLEVAQDIAGWFIERGETVLIEDFGEKQENEVYKSKGGAQLKDYSVVVLINKGSASASEILAGALRDILGIKLIGEKSFGKGSVQEIVKLREDSSLKITIAKWLTPNGYSINGVGLKPDIEVKITEEDYEKIIDPQLKKAIELVNEISNE